MTTLEQYIEQHNGDKPMTFSQYDRYCAGWKKLQPWYRKGMSLAHEQWCEDNWHKAYPLGAEFMHLCWDSAVRKVASAIAGEPMQAGKALMLVASAGARKNIEDMADLHLGLVA